MTNRARFSALLHDGCEPLGGGVGRAVIDIDDFISPSAVEGSGDLVDQRRHIPGLVAHGNNDGNGDLSCVRRRQINAHRLSWPAAADAFGPAFAASASYGADGSRATLLRCPRALRSGTILPSRWMVNPRRRAANQ